MGTEFLKIVEADEAKKIVENLFKECYKIRSENVPIENSYNRVVSEDMHATMDLPPFDKALKDGYAIKSEDSFGTAEENPKILKCIDTVEAGSFSKKTVKKGECIEVSTGTPIPKGTNAIVMVEFSEKLEKSSETININVAILKSVPPNEDIAKKGSDIKKGKLILKKGTALNPVKIGLLSAQGMKNLDVFKKPFVSVISTGNELLNKNEKMEHGKIYDVNTNLIKGTVLSSGGTPITQGIVKDDYDELKTKIITSLKNSDIVICSGGTSAGVGDILKDVIDELGEVLIHGISVKPGKPTLVGKINDKIIIGLPGNPVSAITIYNVFIDPYIRSISGLSGRENSKRKQFRLAKRIHSAKGRMEYLLVEIKNNEVHPIVKDSGAIASLSYADGYTKIPKSVEIIDAGEFVDVSLF
ncbi:MAG: molybdopterin molybdenumtransferase MoeA [Methanobrevibacter sp.]|jgi:molybdopterin molybdotransferase|nr:molybdopterin molybdenumtransferase MoeA [Candidatus Methanovirga aequatorialis]